jgi:hypothetical protein
MPSSIAPDSASSPAGQQHRQLFYNVGKSIPVYVSKGAATVNQSANHWKDFTNIIGVEADVENVEIRNKAPETIYDLNGRRVENTGKGIYT